MLYIIEGIRGSGKTHLIDSFFKRYKSVEDKCYQIPIQKYKFEHMNSFLDLFGSHEYYNFCLGSFSLGKDFQLLSLNKSNFLSNMFVDRGILSTLSYGYQYKRFPEEKIDDIVQYINDNNLLQNVIIIYILPNIDKLKENIKHRNKNDNKLYESFTIEEQLNGYQKFISIFKDNIKIITNNYDSKSEHLFYDEIYEDLLINEHE